MKYLRPCPRRVGQALALVISVRRWGKSGDGQGVNRHTPWFDVFLATPYPQFIIGLVLRLRAICKFRSHGPPCAQPCVPLLVLLSMLGVGWGGGKLLRGRRVRVTVVVVVIVNLMRFVLILTL